MKNIVFTLLALSILFVCTQYLWSEPTEITLMCEDQEDFPNVLGKTDKVEATNPGVAIELIRLMEKKMGIKINIKRAPWKRALEMELKTGAVDGVFTASYKPEREEFGEYPKKDGKLDESKRYNTITYVFFKAKGAKIDWDGKDLKGFTGTIDAPRGYSIVDDLKKKGYTVEESPSTSVGFQKLVAGRVGLVAALEATGDHTLSKAADVAKKVEKVNPPIVSKSYYFILSHQFVKANPVLAEKFWNTMKEVRDKEYKKILAKYLTE